MKKTNRVKNHVKFNIQEENSKKKRKTRRRNKNELDGRTINASLRIKNRTPTPMSPI
jgi:hypothetical protein